MEAEGADFQDWELLHSSDSVSDLVDSSAAQPESVANARNFEGIEGDSEGIIRSDYFSIDSQERYAKRAVIGGDGSEAGSVESDNPSWIDPGSETRYRRRNSGEFWSDSGSDRSEERKSSDFEGKNELGLVEQGKIQVGFEGVGEMKAGSENLGEFGSDEGKNDLGSVPKAKIQEGFEEFGEIQTQYEDSDGDSLDLMKFRDAKKENEMNFVELAKTQEESEFLGKSDSENDSAGESEEGDKHSIENKNGSIEEMKSDGAEGKKNVAWWKVPLELLKYCVFRVSPVWSVSVAAALMGFVILGRRLYKMKRKSRSLELKVTVDDKKVSQFMSRAARLNEAFSVVRRVPIIRSSLPAAGVTPWPVMSLR